MAEKTEEYTIKLQPYSGQGPAYRGTLYARDYKMLIDAEKKINSEGNTLITIGQFDFEGEIQVSSVNGGIEMLRAHCGNLISEITKLS